MSAAQDALIRQVETASGGLNTVRFSDKGQPSYFYRLKKFSIEDLDPSLGTGTHPAFIVGGVEKDEILVGIHQAAEVDGEMVSRAGEIPRTSINHDQAVALARATGTGFCVCTNVIYAALALQARAAGVFPRGNNNYGLAYNDPTEFGVNESGNPSSGGNAAGNTKIRSGSGPVTWNHPRGPWGIQNLNGNVWEWSPGMRIVDAEIQIIADNDAMLAATDLSTSGAWQAIDAATGDLVAPGTADTVKYATSGTADGTLVRNSGGSLSGMVPYGISEIAVQRLRQLALMSPGAPIEGDVFYINEAGERLPVRGGGWASGSGAGVFALNLSFARSIAGSFFGFRPAFVI